MSGKATFDLCDPLESDHAMFDRYLNCTIALINLDQGGKFVATLMSHVELTYDYDTIEDAVIDIPYQVNRYHKDCGF